LDSNQPIPAGQVSAAVTSAPSGAVFTTTYATRTVKVFSITEGEVDSIATTNTQSTAYFSTFSALASLGLSVYVNAAFYDQVTPAGKVLMYVGAPVLITLSLLFAGLGFYIRRRRSSTWDRIKRESQ
jgi:hypothetical protein